MNSSFPVSPFPNGWFRVARSDELLAGGVMPLRYFGKDLVLFRAEDGTPHILDAHCPHLGAHLGHGGSVHNNTIRCPFHGWCFNGNGQCINVPHANKIPPEARIQDWPVCEVNGLILTYYHVRGERPDWKIPAFPEYNSREWTIFRHALRWKVRSFVQEVGENGVDIAHIPYVHSQSVRVIQKYTLKTDGPILTCRTYPKFDLSPAARLLGKEAEGSIENNYYGLGCQVNRVSVKGRIEFNLLLAVFMTPIDEEYLELNCVLSMKKVFNKGITAFLATKLTKEVARTIEQDIRIWENKVYCCAPLLCESDRAILEYRLWARQFYTE